MPNPERFIFAVPSPSVRRDIAAAVRDGIPVGQLADEFQISESTVRAYVREWEGAQRKVQRLSEFERQAVIEGCRRGARKRWERRYGTEVVRQVLGET
ncbi:helix-turn-helix domain-containing protein [Mycobacterium sp. DSM 3803]|nr:helix-turn-helix domain-containing protein [Mycobacterium sp. DSM 3803]